MRDIQYTMYKRGVPNELFPAIASTILIILPVIREYNNATMRAVYGTLWLPISINRGGSQAQGSQEPEEHRKQKHKVLWLPNTVTINFLSILDLATPSRKTTPWKITDVCQRVLPSGYLLSLAIIVTSHWGCLYRASRTSTLSSQPGSSAFCDQQKAKEHCYNVNASYNSPSNINVFTHTWSNNYMQSIAFFIKYSHNYIYLYILIFVNTNVYEPVIQTKLQNMKTY